MWGAIAAGAGILSSLTSGSNAADQAKETAAYNADIIKKTGAEESRRLQRSINQSEGLMSAMSAASGVQNTGSRKLATDDVKTENQAQLAWLDTSTLQKAQQAKRGGQIEASQIRSQALGSTLSGVANLGKSIWGT